MKYRPEIVAAAKRWHRLRPAGGMKHILQILTDRDDELLRAYVSCSCGDYRGPLRPVHDIELERDKGRHMREVDAQQARTDSA